MNNDISRLKAGIKAFENEEYSEAMEQFMPLAEKGIVQAQCYIACIFQGGFGVPVNGQKAIKWYTKAAKQNVTDNNLSAIAYNNLATIYSTGLPGTPLNMELAKKNWSKAKALGFKMIPEDWINSE